MAGEIWLPGNAAPAHPGSHVKNVEGSLEEVRVRDAGAPPDPNPPSRAPLKLGLPPANCSELNDALRMSAEKVVRVTVTLLKVAP